MMRWEYLLVLMGTLFFPLVLSWDKNLSIWKHSAALLKTLASVSVPFWIWDVIATERGHWSFNSTYVAGVYLLGMPIEEWIFFIVVAFVSIFTWESTKYFMRNK
jgi:lycopene cyclase domain-containing protein